MAKTKNMGHNNNKTKISHCGSTSNTSSKLLARTHTHTHTERERGRERERCAQTYAYTDRDHMRTDWLTQTYTVRADEALSSITLWGMTEIGFLSVALITPGHNDDGLRLSQRNHFTVSQNINTLTTTLLQSCIKYTTGPKINTNVLRKRNLTSSSSSSLAAAALSSWN